MANRGRKLQIENGKFETLFKGYESKLRTVDILAGTSDQNAYIGRFANDNWDRGRRIKCGT